MKQTEIPELLEQFEEYQLRALDECIALDDKRIKLGEFLNKAESHEENTVLKRQLEAMNLYSFILASRLNSMGINKKYYDMRRAEIKEE